MNCERARLIRPSRYWRNHLTNSVLAVLIAGLVLVLPIPCAAQRTTGTLRGQVLDPAGAVVANANVTATNQQTGVSIKTATTTAGTYNFPSILPGRYSVTVEMPGFKKSAKNDVPVLADQENVADAQMLSWRSVQPRKRSR